MDTAAETYKYETEQTKARDPTQTYRNETN